MRMDPQKFFLNQLNCNPEASKIMRDDRLDLGLISKGKDVDL